jgi:outer membrane receptor protein involved in Fe transport
MKKIIVLAILFFSVLPAFGQGNGTVSGRVFDSSDKSPLPFANIILQNAEDGTIITGIISDNDGRFVIEGISRGSYTITLTFIGFKSIDIPLLVGELNETYDLGRIELEESSASLDEVVISAKRDIVSANLDSKSYSASEFLATSGGSVLDMMKSLPGLTVNQEGKVELRGSDKVSVLIDGKTSALTGFGSQRGLENIPASQIESIEIINNPSAKYDAAGMAGIINIKLKKENQKGLNGDIGFTFGDGALTKRKADLPTGMSSFSNNLKYTPSLNLNYRTEKLNLFFQSYWINQHKLPNNEFSTRYYDNGTMTESQVAENRAQNHYNIKVGFDWNPTPNQTITLFGLYDYEWHIDTTRVWYFADMEYDDPLRKWGFYESEGTGFTNVTLQHKLDFDQPGHELNSQFIFTKGWEDETYNLYQDGPEPAYPVIHTDKTRVFAPEYVYQLNTDYTKPLQFGRLELGAQGRSRHMPITYTMTKDPLNTALVYDYGNWSEWNEKLLSVYTNMVAEFVKVDIEAGLRGEYTSVDYSFAPNEFFEDDSYSYFDLFPNVRVTLKLNKSNKISLFYNRRIDRPEESILRIFPKYDDPELLKIGNPLLRPQYTQNVELAHKLMWSSGSFYTSLYFKNIDANYTRIYLQDPNHTEITVKAYDNIGRTTNVGIELVFDQKMTSFWNISGSFNVYQNKIFAHSGTIQFPTPQDYSIESRTDTPMFAKLNNQINLPGNIQMDLNGIYYTAKNIGQGKELARGGVDIGLKKVLLDSKLELTLSATDIFNTMGISQDIASDGFRVEYRNFYETQVITFGIKYKF